MLVSILKTLLLSLVTESVIKKLILLLLGKLAEQTDNKVDDEVIRIVKEALGEK